MLRNKDIVLLTLYSKMGKGFRTKVGDQSSISVISLIKTKTYIECTDKQTPA